jgi:hypothetical protein
MKQKSLLVLVCIFSLVASTQAQIKKGSVWLGGNIGYSESDSKSESSGDLGMKVISFKPAAGIAIKENLIAGVTINYSKATNESGGAVMYARKQIDRNIGGGVFLRQYVPVVSRLYIFGQADAGYNKGKSTVNEMNNVTTPTTKRISTTKGWSAGISLTPGVSYAVNNKLQLETGFNSLFSTVYNKSKTTSENSGLRSSTKTFSTGINLENESTFYIGFRFLINSKG